MNVPKTNLVVGLIKGVFVKSSFFFLPWWFLGDPPINCDPRLQWNPSLLRDHWIPTVRPAVDAIARTRAAAKEAGSDDYSSLLYFFPFVSTPLLSLPFGAPNYDHQPAGPALSDNVCSNISSSNISNSALPDCRYVQLSQPQRKAISVRTVRASLHLCPELF